jgi:hypothetical protein
MNLLTLDKSNLIRRNERVKVGGKSDLPSLYRIFSRSSELD